MHHITFVADVMIHKIIKSTLIFDYVALNRFSETQNLMYRKVIMDIYKYEYGHS